MDLRLKTKTVELDGKQFSLCCNFNVLADIEENHGGIVPLLRQPSMIDTVRIILSCMLNDYADSMGWDCRYTPKDAGRVVFADSTPLLVHAHELVDLVYSAIAGAPLVTEPSGEDASKN